MAAKFGKRCFIGITTICFVLGLAFISLLCVVLWQRSLIEAKEGVCRSLACAQAAISLKENMDPRTDPCEDFYKFSCGNFNWRTAWRSSDSKWYAKYSWRINLRIKQILESQEKMKDPLLNRLAAKVRNFYFTCMKEESEKDQIKELVEAIGLMPKPGTAWPPMSLESLVANAHRNDYVSLFQMGRTIDAKMSTTNTIEIQEPRLFLLTMLKERSKYTTAYKNFFRKIIKYLEEDLGVSFNVKPESILQMEMQISEMLMKGEDKRDPWKAYNKWNLQVLQKKTPEFNWRRYFNETLAGSNISLSDTKPIIVSTPKYFNEMNGLIKNNTDLKKNLAMLILVKVLDTFKDRLRSNIWSAFHEFAKDISGSGPIKRRWNYCVSHVNDYMTNIVSRIYVEKYFRNDSFAEVKQLMASIRRAFADRLRSRSWMDEETKRKAEKKLDKLSEQLAYPKYIFDDTWIKQELKSLPNGNNFLSDTISIRRKMRDLELSVFDKKVDKDRWSPYEVIVGPDAAYEPYSNILYIKVGILMEPVFNKDYPKYLNYGGIGMVAGHEITHGFDDENRVRDENGALNQWWSDYSIKNFQKETQCFVDQYSSYSVKSGKVVAKLNGKLSLGENIADNGGLNQAYQAYQSWKEENGEEPKLPDLPYTPEQLFFINYAQNWCTSATDEEVFSELSGVHSPSKFRVLGVVSNMEEFQQAFQCKAGSPMNRRKKCGIWR